jgi:hypothetical protein
MKPISYKIGLPRWNQILTQLRLIHNWVIMHIQWTSSGWCTGGCWFTMAMTFVFLEILSVWSATTFGSGIRIFLWLMRASLLLGYSQKWLNFPMDDHHIYCIFLFPFVNGWSPFWLCHNFPEKKMLMLITLSWCTFFCLLTLNPRVCGWHLNATESTKLYVQLRSTE